MDPASIAAILGLAKTSVDTLGTITDVVRKLKKEDTSSDEYREEIIKLYEQLLDAKEAQIQVRQQLSDLQEIAEKENKFQEIRARYKPLKLDMGGIVLSLKEEDESGELYDRICPVCAEERHMIIPVQGESGTVLSCVACKTQFKNKAIVVPTIKF